MLTMAETLRLISILLAFRGFSRLPSYTLHPLGQSGKASFTLHLALFVPLVLVLLFVIVFI